MSTALVGTVLVWLLVAFFGGIGLYHLKGSQHIRESFTSWGYPRGFYLVNAILQLAAAALMPIPPLRRWGLALGAALMCAAVATLVYHGAWRRVLPGCIVLVVIGAAWYLSAG